MQSYISKHAVGFAIALSILSLYIVAARLDAGHPSTTDALQASADLSNDLAAQAAPRALVANKD